MINYRVPATIGLPELIVLAKYRKENEEREAAAALERVAIDRAYLQTRSELYGTEGYKAKGETND